MDWFFEQNGQQAGPVSEAQLDELLRSGTIAESTLVWREGMSQWQPLRATRAPGPPPVPGAIRAFCAECQREFPQSEMVRLNQSWVCANCKPIFVQRLKEGAAPVGGLVWRDNRRMVLRSESPLPDRCVKCNEPVRGRRLRRQLYWHSPAFYLLLLINLLIYAIVAICVRKKATIHIGVCDAHLRQRLWTIAGSWIAVLGGLALVILSIANNHGWLALVGIILFLVAAIYGGIKGPLVSAAKIDKEFVWVKGVCREYLAELPEWHGPM